MPTAVVALALAAGAAAPAAVAKERPFRASLSGTTVSLVGGDARRCPEVTEVTGEEEVPIWVTTLEGTGWASHLGRVEVWNEYCVNGVGEYGDGVLKLTAANGDVLEGTFSGGVSAWPDSEGWSDFRDEYTFTSGGTGRFATASGSGAETGSINVVTREWTLEITGTLDYGRG